VAQVKCANNRLEFELFKVKAVADEGADLMLKIEAAEADLNAVVVKAGRKNREAKAKAEQAYALAAAVEKRMEKLDETA
jgi:hypothetical protein